MQSKHIKKLGFEPRLYDSQISGDQLHTILCAYYKCLALNGRMRSSIG
jgi:hypothetical protein